MMARLFVIPVLGEIKIVDHPFSHPQPRYNAINSAIGEYFDEPFEHVAVLFEGNRRDMFVGETSSINGRHIRNVRATEIYRNNALTQQPRLDPESLPAISGPAVLFPDRIIWS